MIMIIIKKKKSSSLPLLQTPSCFSAQHLSRDLGPYTSSCLLDLTRAGFCSLETTDRGEQQPALISESWAQGKQLLLELFRDNSYLLVLGPASSTVVVGSTGQSARAEDASLHLFIRKHKTLHGEITTRLKASPLPPHAW